MVNDKPLPVRRGLELFVRLQEASPDIFAQKVVFDGKKNMYSSYRLGIPDDSKEVLNRSVQLCDYLSWTATFQFEITVGAGNETRPARIRIVKIKLVKEINPEFVPANSAASLLVANPRHPRSLIRFTQGKQSFDEEAQTTLQVGTHCARR